MKAKQPMQEAQDIEFIAVHEVDAASSTEEQRDPQEHELTAKQTTRINTIPHPMRPFQKWRSTLIIYRCYPLYHPLKTAPLKLKTYRN